jgi:hypothetical protein
LDGPAWKRVCIYKSGQLNRDQDQLAEAQARSVGPPEVPLWQVRESPHHPQEVRAAQASQVVELPQASPLRAVQEPTVQDQVVQLPVEGPVMVPVWHCPLARHHPQPERAAHAPQVVELAHGSGAVQALRT